MIDQPLRVIKLGGSLLDVPDLADRLQRWLSQQPVMANVLIPGGGPLVQALRRLCAEQKLDEATAHRLATQAMSITARLTAAVLNVPLLTDAPGKLRVRLGPNSDGVGPNIVVVLDTYPAVCGNPATEKEMGATTCDLPQNWNVTSDSIAAWVGQQATCDELVLLKSIDLGSECRSWQKAAELAYVDAHFPLVVNALSITRSVNLRDDSFPEWAPQATVTS